MEAGHRTVIMLAGSFSTTSGGRTASIFRRAREFTNMGMEVYIATRNLRPTYKAIFDFLCKKYDVTGVGFLNFYDFLCEGGLYDQDQSNAFEGFDRSYYEMDTLDEFGRPCIRELFDADKRRYRVRYLRTWKSADELTQAEEDACETASRVGNTVIYPAGVGCPDAALVHACFFDPADGRAYFVQYPNPAHGLGKRIWLRRDGSSRVFEDGRDALEYWYAALAKRFDNVYFLEDDHTHTEALLDNRYDKSLRVIATIHSTLFTAPYTYGSPLVEYLSPVRTRMHDYAAVVNITPHMRQHLANLYGLRENMFYISHFCPEPPRIEAEKQANTIGVCTRLVGLKRVDDMIKAVGIASKHVEGLRFLIYGNGEEENALHDIIDSEGLDGVVELRGFTSEPLQAIAQCELSLCASLYEGLSFSIYESLLVGTPVISYDLLYGPRAFIRDGENGRIVENGNIEAMAQAIVWAFSDRDRLSAMSQAARQLDSVYAPDNLRARWLDLFDYVDAHFDDAQGRYSMVADVDLLGQAPVSERMRAGETVRMRILCKGGRAPSAYQLNFFGSERVDLRDDLYVAGSVVERTDQGDIVEFAFDGPAEQAARILKDADELRLFVSFGRFTRAVMLEELAHS